MLFPYSTKQAPWYVIPADRKWFARIAAAAVIVQTLIEIDPEYPTPDEEASHKLKLAKAQLESEAREGQAPDPFEQHDRHRK